MMCALDHVGVGAKAALLLPPIAASWWFYPWVAVRALESPLAPLLIALLRKG